MPDTFRLRTRDTGTAQGLQVKVISPPAVEPITRAEAKSYAKIDHAVDDTLVDELIVMARQLAEEFLNRKLITQTAQAFWKSFQEEMIVPFPPHQSIDIVTRIFEDDTEVLVLNDDYFVNGLDEKRVQLPSLISNNSLQIEFKAGYGNAASDVPKAIKIGVLKIFANAYENRQEVEKMATIPVDARSLLQRFVFLNA